jgi:predicted RNA-binding protein with TRAM domain
MEISDQLRCLFSAQVEERDGAYVIEVPKREIRLENIDPGGTYRVALLPGPTDPDPDPPEVEATPERDSGPPEPPVDEGETRELDIETIGDQGDGIARVERGFVVIVPETEKGERVTVEITDVRENVAFAEVQDRQTHF